MVVLIGGGRMDEMQDINARIVDVARTMLDIVGRKPYVVFFPTAAYESKPAINSFMREYGSRLKCKATCAIWQHDEMTIDRITEKCERADIIYLSGGNYLQLVEQFGAIGIGNIIARAHARGAVIVGNSAGAIWLAARAVSDCNRESSGEYTIVEGSGLVTVDIIPHADDVDRIDYADNNGLAMALKIATNECIIIE